MKPNKPTVAAAALTLAAFTQENHAYNILSPLARPGDEYLVVLSVPSHSQGWRNHWTEAMTCAIGHTLQVAPDELYPPGPGPIRGIPLVIPVALIPEKDRKGVDSYTPDGLGYVQCFPWHALKFVKRGNPDYDRDYNDIISDTYGLLGITPELEKQLDEIGLAVRIKNEIQKLINKANDVATTGPKRRGRPPGTKAAEKDTPAKKPAKAGDLFRVEKGLHRGKVLRAQGANLTHYTTDKFGSYKIEEVTRIDGDMGISDFLETLPSGYRELALDYFRKFVVKTGVPPVVCNSAHDALKHGVNWSSTKEGYDWWSAVAYAFLQNSPYPLPRQKRTPITQAKYIFIPEREDIGWGCYDFATGKKIFGSLHTFLVRLDQPLLLYPRMGREGGDIPDDCTYSIVGTWHPVEPTSAVQSQELRLDLTNGEFLDKKNERVDVEEGDIVHLSFSKTVIVNPK